MSTRQLLFFTLSTFTISSLLLSGTITFANDNESPPSSLNDIFINGDFSLTVKTLYFERNYEDETPDQSTLALGGNLNYETTPFYGLSAGVGFKTSQGDLANSSDEVYRGLLATGDSPNDDESYATLDEYFLRYTKWNSQLTVGAQSVDTPWLNGNDIRMTPKKYYGLSLTNTSIDDLKLSGYYLADWLDWVAEDYESISSALTDNPDDDEGVLIGGVDWQVTPRLNFQVWDYYFYEVMNSLYFKAQYSQTFGEYTWSADLRYFHQQDVGDQLSGDISTYTAGGNISLKAYGADLTVYYGTVGSDDLIAQFGENKIISLQNLELDRADEDGYAVKLGYNFKHLGINGLSIYFVYGNFDTPDSGLNGSPDAEEFDFNLQYQFGGWFKDCSLRIRHAIIEQDEDIEEGKDWTDTRFYLVYSF